MDFPLWYLLIPYALVVVGTFIFFFFNIYHVAKFGVKSLTTEFVLATYGIAYLVVLGLSAFLLMNFDWSATISLNDVLPMSSDSTANFGL